MRIHRAGVGENDLIAGFETIHDLNGIHRAAAQFHWSPNRFGRAGDEFENAYGVVFLTERGTSDVDDVVEPFELDRSVNT